MVAAFMVGRGKGGEPYDLIDTGDGLECEGSDGIPGSSLDSMMVSWPTSLATGDRNGNLVSSRQHQETGYAVLHPAREE